MLILSHVQIAILSPHSVYLCSGAIRVDSPLLNVCTTRKLSVWISVGPRSLLQTMQSLRISALSVVLCTFFSFHPSCFTYLFVRARKVTWLSYKRKKRGGARSNHALCESQRIFFMRRRRPWTCTQAHPSYLLSNARLQERFKRRTLKTSTGHLQQEDQKFCSAVKCGFRSRLVILDISICSKYEKTLSRCFHKSSLKTVPEDKKKTTRASTSAPSSAARFSPASKSKHNPKSDSCKPFTNSLLTNILDNQSINTFSNVRDEFDLNCNLWHSQWRWANST